MSEEEAKIKADLEKEIEEGLQEEILDNLVHLSRKLERLHARQKARNEEYLKNKSDCTSLINNLSLENDPKPQSPALIGFISPSSSPGRTKADKQQKNPAKNVGDRIYSSRNLQKEFDWVRSLRSASSSLSRSKPSRTISNPERNTTECSSFSSSPNRSFPSPNRNCSLAVSSTESNNGKRGSINYKSPLYHPNGYKPYKGNNYNNIGLVPKEDRAILERHKGNGKSNTNVRTSSCPRQRISCSAMENGDILEGNTRQQNKFFTDMISKLKDSTMKSVENPTKLNKDHCGSKTEQVK